MRSLILSLFIVLGATNWVSAQEFETCADSQMPANVTAAAPSPSFSTTINFDPTWITNGEGYTPSNLGAGFTTSYFSFTVDMMQFYTINIQGAPGSPAIGNQVSVSFDSDCLNLMTSSEFFADAVPANAAPQDLGCINLSPGTTYTIAIAMDPAQIGDVIINVVDAVGAGNVSCATATPMAVGSNIGNNSCSSGLVWYSYTVTNGGMVSISTSVSSTGNDISAPVITQTSIDGCVTTTTDVAWTCLPPGTVVSFEVGDDTAPIEQGNFNVDIVDDATGLPNELCTDVTPVAIPSCATSTLTFAGTNNTTVGACSELIDFGGCGVFNTEATVWFAFTTDAGAQTVDIEVTTGTISGATFALIDGSSGCPAGSATLGGCQTTGSLMNQPVTGSTTYYIAVATSALGTDGTFTLTVTPENPPANDDCATEAIDISATAALGVDGTTGCASSDANDFCPVASEDHVVYYTYTVDAGILGNRDVTFTFAANMATTGTPATGLFFGLFEDCAGTAYTNMPNVTDDPCDALTGTVTYECVEPGTVLTIAVGSTSGTEGDFNIMITEDDTNVAINDACANPLPLMVGVACTDVNDSADNTNGCPEITDLGSSCMFSSDLVVWYTLTLPAGATGLDFSSLSAGAQLALFENDCPTLTLIDDCFTGNTSFSLLTDGGTYLLAVSQTVGAEGPVTFTWTPLAPPANDDCATGAIDISATAALGFDGTTACATADINDFCPLASEDHVVYYTYTVDAGILGNRDVTFTFVSNMATTGTPATGLFFGLFEDCVGTAYTNMPNVTDDPCDALTGTVTYECVEPGTVLTIAVGSADGNEGDFNITITEDDTNVAINDACANPLPLMVGVACTDVNDSADNTNGCPEITDLGSSCTFSSDLVVWYTLTLPAGATGIEFSMLSAGAQLALFENDCPTLTLVDDCFTGDTEFTGLTDGGIYLLAVSQTFAAEGPVTFTWSPQAIPTNDDCDLGTNPDILSVTAGTTGCADYDVSTCGIADPVNDHQVFYIYSNTSGSTVDLEITIEADGLNGNPATQVSITAADDDCMNLAGFYPGAVTNSEWCDILGMGMQTLPCIEDGETVVLIFSSVEGEEGDFTIAAVEGGLQPLDDNDECVDAFDITPSSTCVWETVTADNTNACPEDFAFGGGCDFDTDPTVWYSFTVPAAAGNYSLEIQNITDASSYLTIFDASIDCDAPGASALAADCETGAGPHVMYDPLVAGMTYLIAFGNPTPGAYSFQIKINLLPDNDECVDAVALVANTATLGSTICATQEAISYNSAVCADTDETNTVWYEVMVGPGEKGFNLTVTGAGTTPITMGDINAVVFETTAMGCIADASTFIDEDCLTLATLTEQFECVGEGTYIIRISTSDMNAGEFNILFEPLTAIMFDVCSDPDAATFSPVIDCEWMPATAMTIGACPEAFDFGNNCGFDDFPVIWYEVTAPANATELDLMTVSSTAGSPFIAVFEGLPADCDLITSANAVAGSNCYSGLFADLDTEGSGTIDVVGSTTYYIGVGSDDVNGSSIVFEIKFITPPLNDECEDGIVLTSGVSQSGTTTCATQAAIPYDSGVCTDLDETNTVWYEFTVPDGVNGFDVTVTAAAVGGFTGNVNIVVFESTALGCIADASTFSDEACATSATLVEDFECIGPGTYVIRISTSLLDEGDFDILVSEYTSPVSNDLCSNPTVINIEPECEWYLVDANTVDACPEQFDFVSDCGFDDFPVVWYEINVTDDAATEIQINLISSATGNGFYSVFNGNPIDCNDLTPASVSGFCETTIGENTVDIDIEANGPQTYLIGVGADAVGGSASIQFEIKVIVPPMNDDPCDAELITTAGDVSTTVMGSTVCAGMDVDEFTCEPTAVDENSVWYEYTIPTGTTGFIVTLTNTGTGQDFAVGVYEFLNGCLMNPTLLDNDVETDCALDDGGEMKFTCLDENTTAYIMVSTLDAEAGDFDLTIDPIVPDPLCIDNDLCDMADNTSPVATPITDGGQVCVTDCNLEACPEDFFAGACAYNDFPTVFYTVTTDALADDATMTVILSSMDGNPIFSVFEFDCANPTSVTAESFCVEGDGAAANLSNMEVDANTTYIIAVALDEIDEEGGEFNLCVNVTTSCNDDPCSPYPLVQGDGVNGIALDCDNNLGATEEPFDYVSADCDDPLLFASTVYFSYTVPANISSFTLFYTNDPVDGIQNAVGINIMVYDAANCAFQQAEVVDQQCIQPGNVEPMEVDCPTSGDTYLIQITSAAGDEGEFDIEITETIQDDPCAANDDCDFAMVLDVSETCEWLEFPDCNIQACPEEFVDPGMQCAYDASAVVWYTFTTPPNATTAHIELLAGTVTDPTWGLFIDNGCAVPPTALNADVICVTTGGGGSALEEDILIDENTTYYIAVGSETNIEGDFTLNIKIDVPPINDDPCINDDNPPFDLTGGGSHDGSTCCARGPKDFNDDGSVADWENQAPCNNATEDAAVWYMFTPDPADAGYDIIVEGGSISNQMTVQVYAVQDPASPCAAAPAGDEVVASSCTALSTSLRVPNCDPTLTYFVKVTSADDDCGDFIITVTPAVVCDFADTCDEATDALETSTQESCEDPLEFFTVPGCLDLACPDEDQTACMQDQGPTVWFKINIDDPDATKLITQIDAPGFDAVWQVFEGMSCADMMPIAEQLVIDGTTQTYPCSNSDGDAENIFQTPIDPDAVANGLMYWVSVTAIGEVTDPNFDFVYNSTLGCLACTGDDATDCGNGTFVASVLENGAWVEVADDYQFCQGIDVQVCFEFNYNTTGSGNDWIHGFVPFFGPGWDVDDDALAAIGALGNFEFFSSQGNCAPFLNGYGLPNVCTYIDDDGFLQLCNSACDPAGCPCTGNGGMQDGDPLPSGFWYNTNGGSSTCGTFGCSPASFYGWPGGTNVDVSECIELKTKIFDSVMECQENNSLSFGIQTFSDAVSGCWVDSSPCIVDPSVGKFDWVIECNVPPPVEGEDEELCFDGITDIFLVTSDGSPLEIQVDVIENPSVTGENSHTFTGGSGTIMDDLTNTSTTEQIVQYIVYSIDPTLQCPGVLDTIEVLLYPELVASFPPVYVCEGDCTDITPDVFGGVGNPYTYNWSTGETTPSINVCPTVPTTYSVTVMDALGCMDVTDVQVDVKPPVEVLLPPSIDVCKDDNFNSLNPDYIVCLDFISGSSPYGVTWNPPVGLIGNSAGFAGECFMINELASSEFGGMNGDGVYTLSVTVVDFFGCMGTTDMIVNVTGELALVVDYLDLECGETEVDINATGIDLAGNPVTNFILYGGCPGTGLGDFLEDAFSTTGVVQFPTQDLLAYTCYTIVAQTESGCQTTQDITIPLTVGTPIEITGTPDVCIGDEATITITNATDFVSFEWTPNIGSTGSVTFMPDSTVTYFVEATDGTGCKSQEEYTVTVNPLPTIGLSGSTTFCENGTATITASGGTMYTWTDSGAGATGPVYTTGTAGDVTLVMQDANGCESDTTITFTQENIITINLGDVNICDGMGDTVFVSNDFINIEWYDATPTLVSDTSFYVITGAGTFTVQASDGATGCDAMGSFEVMDFSTPSISVSDTVEVCRIDSGIDSLCVNFNNQVTGSGGVWTQVGVIPGFTFDPANLDNVCFQGIQTGCYEFRYTTNNAQAPCMNVSETMTVCVKACPCPSPATQAPSPMCNIGTKNLQLSVVTSDPGTWSIISGPAGQDVSGILNGAIFTAGGILEGDYLLQFSLDNPGGPACIDSSVQTLTVFEAPMLTGSDGVMCNIGGQSDPIELDLYDLVNVDATDGGSWAQVGTPTVNITGATMSTIMSADLSSFPETLVFEYTSGVEAGSPCPPDVVTVEVLVRDCNCPFVNVLRDTLCNNGMAIDLFTLLQNPDGLTGTWSTTGNLVGASMFDPAGLPSGLYNVTFTLDSSPGPTCALTYSNDILVRRQSIAVPRMGVPPCSMDTGNGPTTSNLYLWLEPGYSSGTWTQTGGAMIPFMDNGLDMAVVDFVSQTPGAMFEFTFMTNDAQQPCTNVPAVVTITVLDCNCPPIMLSDPAPICNDSGEVDLCALIGSSDPGTFAVFDQSGNDQSANLDGTGCLFDPTDLDPGSYSIIYTLDDPVAGICEQTDTVILDISEYLSVMISEPDTVCSDPDGLGLMALNFNGLLSTTGLGTWSDDDNSMVVLGDINAEANVSFSDPEVPAGSYNFTYTIDNADPCPDFVQTITVEVIDMCNCPPFNPLDPEDVCNTDGPVNLSQYSDIDNPGTWSSTDLTVENGSSLLIDGVASGTYTLTYTILDPLPDCPDSEDLTIFIGEPAFAGTPTEPYIICEGVNEVIDLFDLLTDEDSGGTWTETSGTMSTGFNDLDGSLTTDAEVAGTYTFEYTITENDPCPMVSETVTVIIEEKPIADAGLEKFIDCINSSAILGGPNTTVGTDIEYTWVNTTSEENVGTTETIEVGNAGIYQLTVLNTATGCIDSSMVEVIKSDDLPEMIVDPVDISCFGFDDGGVILSGQVGGDGNYTYSLDGGAVTDDPNDFSTLPAGDYIIEIIDGNNCTNSYPFTISEPAPVAVEAGPAIVVGEVGEEFVLSIEPFDTSTVTSIVWSFSETTEVICSGLNCTTITVNPTEITTNYYVEVMNENECIAFDEVQIQLQQIVDVVFPNIITPNGDNINDRFFVKSGDVETIISMKIFDRWGEKLFDLGNFSPRDPELGWDGKFNGKKVVPGVYVFTVEVLFINGETELFKGDVTVTDSE